jgi:hypothetical protein
MRIQNKAKHQLPTNLYQLRNNMPTKEEMNKFSRAIDGLVANTDYNYIEAIVEHCKKTGLEIEVAATLINANLKSKIEMNAMDNNLLKEKSSRLPI